MDQGFTVGDWWVEPEAGTLSRNGDVVRLRPLQMSLLMFLASSAGRVITKEQLFAQVWQGAVVEDGALPRCVSELRRLLGDDAQHPSYIATVPRKGYRLVAAVAMPRTTPSPASPLLRRRLVPLVGVGLAALGAILLVAAPRRGAVEAPPLTPEVDRRVARDAEPPPGMNAPDRAAGIAVLDFRNLSDDTQHAWLSTALSEMITSELALTAELRVIPAEAVAHARRALSLNEATAASVQSRRRLRSFLGAERLVYGSFLALEPEATNPQIRIDLRIEDPQAREGFTSLVESGPRSELFEMIHALGRRLRQRWATTQPLKERVDERSFLPRSPSANRLYLQGLHELRRFRTQRARDLLVRSIAEESDNPLSHRALAEAWSELGYASKALETARRANELSEDLPRDLRLWIEASYLDASSQWEQAIDVYRALWLFSPGNVEYGIHLAQAQRSSGKARAALETLETIRTQQGLSEPSLAVSIAHCYEHLGDKARALEWAEQAIHDATELEADLIVAEAHQIQAVSLHALGRFDESIQAIETAISIFARAGDRNSANWARTHLAGWMSVRGDSASAVSLLTEAIDVFVDIGNRKGEARALRTLISLRGERQSRESIETAFERILQIEEELGDDRSMARALNSYGTLEARLGRLKQAQGLFEQALVFFRQAEAPDGINLVLTNLGVMLGLQAEMTAALEALRESLEQAKKLEEPHLISLAQLNLGNAELGAGHLEVAERTLSAADATWVELENPSWRASALDSLAEVAIERDDHARAHALLEQAITLKRELDEPNELAGSYATLSIAVADGGDLAQAERLARRALELASPDRSQHLAAAGALAQALLASSRQLEALAVIERTEKLLDAERTEDVYRMRLAIVAARIRAATGQTEPAVTILRRLSEQARRGGFWMLAAEAEIALGEIELELGDSEGTRRRLQALELEASTRGCTRKARHAAEVLAGKRVPAAI